MSVCTSAKDRVWVCKTWLCSETRENACSGQSQQTRSWRYPNRVIWSKSIGRATHLSKDSLRENGGTTVWQAACNSLDLQSTYPQTWNLCVPFFWGCHPKFRWCQWSSRGSCVTKATTCTSIDIRIPIYKIVSGACICLHVCACVCMCSVCVYIRSLLLLTLDLCF